MDDDDGHTFIAVSSYQRLEFLGDAVVGMVVTKLLFECSPAMSPGVMTEWRSLAVGNELLAVAVLRSGLHRALRHSSAPLAADIEAFAAVATHWTVEDIAHATDEQFSDSVMTSTPISTPTGSIPSSYSNTQVLNEGVEEGAEKAVSVPSVAQASSSKILGDVFEALVGAVFVDSGGCMSAVEEVVQRLLVRPYLLEPLEAAARSDWRWGPHRHPVSVLTEIMSTLGCNCLVVEFEEEAVSVSTTESAGGIHNNPIQESDGKSYDRDWGYESSRGGDTVVVLNVLCCVQVHGDSSICGRGRGRSRKVAKKMAAVALLDSCGGPEGLIEKAKEICHCNKSKIK